MLVLLRDPEYIEVKAFPPIDAQKGDVPAGRPMDVQWDAWDVRGTLGTPVGRLGRPRDTCDVQRTSNWSRWTSHSSKRGTSHQCPLGRPLDV